MRYCIAPSLAALGLVDTIAFNGRTLIAAEKAADATTAQAAK